MPDPWPIVLSLSTAWRWFVNFALSPGDTSIAIVAPSEGRRTPHNNMQSEFNRGARLSNFISVWMLKTFEDCCVQIQGGYTHSRSWLEPLIDGDCGFGYSLCSTCSASVSQGICHHKTRLPFFILQSWTIPWVSTYSLCFSFLLNWVDQKQSSTGQ